MVLFSRLQAAFRQAGFTLIEVMIAVAVVGILSAIAYPSYTDYILRGKLIEPTNSLLGLRVAMEQYYQDNRTYANVSAAIVSPCDTTRLPAMKYFTMTCVISAAPAGYTATATGMAGSTSGFIYKIDNTDVRSTTVSSAWGGATSACWIMKKGTTC